MSGGRPLGATKEHGPRYIGRFSVETGLIALNGVLGALVLLPIHWSLAVLEVVATALAPIWMLRTVCPNCSLYGTEGCPSGFGVVSERISPRGDPKRFREAFARNVYGVMPAWFLPVAGVAYMLYAGIHVPLVLLSAFVLAAFVVTPLRARYDTCRRCPRREDCPWGARIVPARGGPRRG
jgi:hypothetical protein